MCVADWMRRLTSIAGMVVLVMLSLLLWSDAAFAACPHGMQVSPAAPVHVTAPQDGSHAAADTMTAVKAAAGKMDPGRQAPGRSHHAVQPCCAGMACSAMAIGLPGAELTSPVVLAGQRLGWSAGPLREGLGTRPDLPPPRLG